MSRWTVRLWKHGYLACALQKKQQKLRIWKLLSPPDRTGASGRKKQESTEENRVRFDGPETTRLLSISETAQKIRLRLKIQFIFEVLNVTWPAQNRKAGGVLDEKDRKDGHLHQTCEKRHFHTLKRWKWELLVVKDNFPHPPNNHMCDGNSFRNFTHP